MGLVRVIAAVVIAVAIVPFHRLLHVLLMGTSAEFVAADVTNFIGVLLGASYLVYEILVRPMIAK